MTSRTSCSPYVPCTFPRAASCTDAAPADHLAASGDAPALPVWQASLRMAVISAASVAAAVVMATGLTGCADMSGISPVATVRSAESLGLATPTTSSQAPLATDWRSATSSSTPWSPRCWPTTPA